MIYELTPLHEAQIDWQCGEGYTPAEGYERDKYESEAIEAMRPLARELNEESDENDCEIVSCAGEATLQEMFEKECGDFYTNRFGLSCVIHVSRKEVRA